MNKITTLLLASALATTAAQAQVIPISAAHVATAGTVVTVRGIVSNGAELGTIRYFDDGTGGIAAYGTTIAGLVRGDSVEITGTIAPYNGLIELNPISNVTVVSQGNALHGPFQFEPSEWANAYSEGYEGRLVQLNKVPRITTNTGDAVTNFAANVNYRINNNAAQTARINAASSGATGLVGKPAPTDTFSIAGIMSQFTNASNPPPGYQLLPRLFDDIISGAKPVIASTLQQTDVSQTSLSLTFTTNNAGSTLVQYGTTRALGMSMTDTTQGTAHAFTLSGLLPGTIYYVQVSSSNSNGVSVGKITPFVTESASSGIIKTYFTRPVDTLAAMPGNKAVYLNQLMDDTLISYINRAQESLDIAIYNWNNSGLSDITAAVNAAYLRGVKVRVVNDGSTANLGLNSLNTGIKVIESPQGTLPTNSSIRYGIMHNKFVIIDCESANPNSPWVWTGSTNWTRAMMTTDWNNTIAVQDQALARVYKLEFEEMWGSDSLRPGAIYNGTTGTARFGPYKTDNTPHMLKVAGKPMQSYFSPSDGAQNHLIETINTANTSFQFSIYTFTRFEIGNALRDAYSRIGAGNCSRGLIDDTSNSGSGAAYRAAAATMGTNVSIFSASYNPTGIYHHKYLIVDQDNAASDPILLTGSYNWSAAADGTNDENELIVHDQLVANQYFQEFSQRWRDDGHTNCVVDVAAVAAPVSAQITLAPNPASASVTVSLPGMAGRTVHILAVDGRTVVTAKATSGTLNLPVQNLQPGAYLVRVEGVAVPVRFIKQ